MSVRRFVDKVAVTSEPGLTNAQLMLTNHDLRPVDPERRKWGSWNFVAFWIADSANINTWMIASSFIVSSTSADKIALSWWQAWICVWVGYSISAMLICATGRIGAQYHISFPVVARASFGVWGSLWPVFNRAAMACVWYGVQGWIGGECVTVMLEAIWPSYANIPNHIPSSGTTTKDFVSYFLFWLCSLPAIWFPVHQIRHLFTVKAVYTPIAMIAFFAWAIHRANGIGPIINQPSSLHGSALAWAVIKGIMSSIANFATLIVNDPDFSRFAKSTKSSLWSQLFSIPIGFAITSFIGIIASSSSNVIYGTTIWSPLTLLSKFLDGASSGERFGVFVIALGFALAQLGTNIAANSVSAGTDMTALMPRFLNIRRGGYVCAMVGLAMCPWKLASSSNNFTTYLSAYAVFLSSIAAVIITDYYFVRKGYLEVRELYSARKRSPYYFTYGFSWRAFTAYISGILVNIVGFAGAVGATVPIGAQYIYNIDYIAGFIVSSIIYYVLCLLFPIPATSATWNEVELDTDHFGVAYGQEVTTDEESRSIPEEETLAYNKKDKSQGYATF